MIFSICQSILIQTETNIVLNNSLHQLVRAPHDVGLFGTIFLFHEWQNSVTWCYISPVCQPHSYGKVFWLMLLRSDLCCRLRIKHSTICQDTMLIFRNGYFSCVFHYLNFLDFPVNMIITLNGQAKYCILCILYSMYSMYFVWKTCPISTRENCGAVTDCFELGTRCLTLAEHS